MRLKFNNTWQSRQPTSVVCRCTLRFMFPSYGKPMKFKKYLLFSFIFAASGINAANHQHTGLIDTIHVSDSFLGREGAWIRVKGFDSAGSCTSSGNGLIWLLAKNDENGRAQYSLALSAFATNSPVTVSADDSQKASDGVCYLRTIYMSK